MTALLFSHRVAAHPRHNLPAELSTFVGRAHELANIESLLLQSRLLTLTGVGGVGKTRLALRVAAHVGAQFPDGVWLVQLAPLADSRLVPRAVAAVLGVRGAPGHPLLATLSDALATRRLLLVLDNCEHLIGSVARTVETLLRACPHLRILATSREPLHVSGEALWRVPSLMRPEEATIPLERLVQVEAVALFLDRARARRPDFVVTERNAPAVVTVCRALDGIPLAIELAAAQMAVLSPEQIVGRIDRTLALLRGGDRTSPRQQTLQAALDWSHDLLTAGERVLLRRLAVFAGGFDIEAAEYVCSGESMEHDNVLPLLTGLIEKSLVEPRLDAKYERYRLLEPVRQYAQEHLQECGEAAAVQARHACHYMALAERAEPHLMSGARGPWMERLALDQDNVRAALAWSRRATDMTDIEVGLRIAGALVFFWALNGEVNEGLESTEAVLARGKDADLAARSKALYAAGELAWLVGQAALGRERAEESERLFRALGDRRGLAYALQSLLMTVDHPRAHESVEESLRLFDETGDAWGAALAIGAADIFPLLRDGDPTGEGRARLEEGLTRARAIGDNWLTAQRLNFLGDLDRVQGNDAGATASYKEALSLLRKQDLTGTVPSLLHNLGYLALRRSHTRHARKLFQESVSLFRDQGDRRGIADCLIGLGSVAIAMKQPEHAARLFGAAEALRQASGATIWPSNLPDYERSLTAIRTRLDSTTLAAAWEAGRSMSWQQVMTEATGHSAEVDSPVGSETFDLTAREREVAALVAQGLTNRQIGAALFITSETARLHVKHILQKLGFTSRVQIAAWAVEHGLAVAPIPD